MARILIVDDSVVSRTNLRKILVQGGHEVVAEAGDGQDGLEKYGAVKPDLVTMDITMPRISGIDCLKAIMAADPEARVMMITALGQGAKVLEALEAGARHYVTKPFETEAVLNAVNEVLAA